ncbi:MAG TPA: hypothetical protein DEA88_13525 [Erwinia persicina]|nr:hypothetical protein [Erwinia persicina]HBT28763.1 hypothetical protein [Erwinia persicina]
MEFNRAKGVPVFNSLILNRFINAGSGRCTIGAQGLYYHRASVCRKKSAAPTVPVPLPGRAFRKYLFSSWHDGLQLVSMKQINFAIQE